MPSIGVKKLPLPYQSDKKFPPWSKKYFPATPEK
jgi:hypothetical protein